MLRLTLIAFGNKMPAWVSQASGEFIKRLSDGIAIQLIELPILKRGKASDLARILEKEEQLLRAAIPPQSYLVALDRTGKQLSSEQLASKLAHLQQITPHLCCIIGGPEGLAEELVAECNERWSLSSLTFPHTIARVILLETIYRSWSILHNHPYHK
jgi:23S rRNA (pseudouridine1915-N3)-methyltransferase